MMDQYRYVMLLLVLALPLSLTGCKEAPATETTTAEPSIEVEEQTDNTISVDIKDVKEEDIGEDAYWYYVRDADGIDLAIIPEATVRSFKFVGLHAEEAESGLRYVIDNELYSVDELGPEKPFLVRIQFVGLLPTYGIVFEDPNGQEKFYTINMRGTGPEESYPYYLDEIE